MPTIKDLTADQLVLSSSPWGHIVFIIEETIEDGFPIELVEEEYPN